MQRPVHQLRLCVACIAVGLVGTAVAADATKSKPPKPAVAIRTATKNFVKSKSYRVVLEVTGGYAEDASHAVKEKVVSENYLGNVHAGIMHLPEVKAYRTAERGSVYRDGAWKDILSVSQTVRVVRLFRFPEEVLANAYKHAIRSGRWLEPEKKVKQATDPGEPSPGGDRPSPITAVGGSEGSSGGGAPAAETPRVVRVEAPPEEALRHIIDVQNSNCFGGG